MPETKKVPAIRFNGFSDDWEQRKLGEVGKARSGVGFPDIEQGGTSGTPFFKVSDMNNDGNENEMNVANNYVTDAQITARRWSLIEEVPAIFFAKVGAAVMLNRKRLCRFPFLLDNNTMAYSLGKDQWDADFAKALFETVDLTSLVQVGALPSYNAGDVEAMEIMLPDVTEQHQIGAYFWQLDNLITLHQRKYDKLVNVKKSMLEKMFPRDGVSVPEIRFAGFTNPWEQRKLSDLAEIVGGGTPDTNNSAYWDGDIDWYAPAEMEGQRYAKGSVRKITELGLQKSSAKILPAHRTVLFTSRAGIGKMAILQRSAATNQGFQSLVLKDGTDPYFIYSMGEKIKDMAECVASGSTFLEISGKMLGNLEVMVPNLKEQESIATFFRVIDDLITLHQRKLEKLKQLKASFLEKMFV